MSQVRVEHHRHRQSPLEYPPRIPSVSPPTHLPREDPDEPEPPDVPATSHPIPLTNVMRDDAVVPTLDRDEVLASAPAQEDGRFLVPQILGEE